MKNLKKKGFTIVELVIVIAVIAVLAAVLIPTFVNLTKKANQSADIQATRQMNTALAIAGELDDIDDVIDALADAGYNSKEALIPVSTGYTFYWHEETKQIILVNEKNEVVFPEGVEYSGNGVSLENSVQYIDVVANDAETFMEAILNGNEEIKLSADISLPHSVQVAVNSNVTLDLNGKTITTEYTDAYETNHYYAVEVLGKLTVKNGTINSRGIKVLSESAEVTIEEGTTINSLDANGGYCIFAPTGGNITINGGTFNALNGDTYANPGYEPGAIWFEGNGNLTINGGTFNVKSGSYAIGYVGTGTCTINKATINAERGGIAAEEGTTIINNDVKISVSESSMAYPIYANNSVVTVNGGSFTGGKYTYCVDGEGTGSITLNDGTKLTAGQSR